MSGDEEIPSWMAAALGRMRMPDVPVGEPWDFSAAALLTPRLPRGTRWLAGKLDRLGAVRITQDAIAIDTADPIRWTDLTEVRIRPRAHALTDTTKDAVIANLTRLLPVGRRVPRKLLTDAADAVLAILRRVERETDSSTTIPYEFVHRRRRRADVVTPGLVASAVLTLPQVAASVLATAERNGVPLTRT
jgi:hypothetical protein